MSKEDDLTDEEFDAWLDNSGVSKLIEETGAEQNIELIRQRIAEAQREIDARKPKRKRKK